VKPRSLYGRLIVGTVGWVLAIFILAFVIGSTVMYFHPRQALLIHNSFLVIACVVLVTAGVTVIRRGLSPFVMLQARLADVRAGRTARLEGQYPTEVEPLVHDLNLLLEERERRVAQAAAKAGDLAHGLKTPLAIVMQEIDRAERVGQTEFAATLREQVDRMRRQIESHLAQARATAGGAHGARANVLDAAESLVRAMQRLYADRRLSFAIDVPSDVVVRVPAEDLEELIGNLLDNACKWARSRVHLAAVASPRDVTITVDDDGAGLDPALREAVLQRGVRADERAPGTGLGLAIVRDLAQAYGGSIVLDASAEGGLRARLTLPVPGN
jgi:signal transduction histidine kinase